MTVGSDRCQDVGDLEQAAATHSTFNGTTAIGYWFYRRLPV